MMKQITVLTNTRFPSTAAHSTYLARLCDSLSASGANVELIVPKRFKEVEDDPFVFYGVQRSFIIKKIWSFDFVIFGRALRQLAFAFQYLNFYVFVLIYFLFRPRNRVIYTMDSIGCVLHFLGYRVVFETHVGIGMYRRRMLPLINMSEKIVVINSIIKNDFMGAGFAEEKILVAPNGVDLTIFSGSESKQELRRDLKLPIDAKIISYVGKYKTMGMDKGVRGLVKAFNLLNGKIDNPHILIVGLSEDEKKELAEVFLGEGIPTGNFTLVSHVSYLEVSKFMRASDVLIMNYPDTPYYRSFMSPMKMFEYMASRRPIVTSDLPSIREVLDETMAEFVLPDDTESLAKGIIKILGNELYARSLTDRAFEKVSELTWEKRARRILNFIFN